MAHRSQDAPYVVERFGPSMHAVARAVSLGLSISLLLIVLLVPQAVKREDALVSQAVVPIMLLGIVGGFVHAFGYKARSPVLATMFGPWAAWPLMVSSLVFLISGMSA